VCGKHEKTRNKKSTVSIAALWLNIYKN
jgi:hypothetical protein